MKGKVLIAHVFFDILGGGEFLALSAAKALRESGYEVTIYTCTPLNPQDIKRIFGINIDDVNIVVERIKLIDLLGKVSRGRLSRLRRLMAYKKFFKEYMPKVAKDYDLVIETQSNIVSPADISYIHFPALLDYSNAKVERSLYWRAYNRLIKLYARSFKTARAGKVLTNSFWTAAHIYSVYHIVPDVVYPPVAVEQFTPYASNDKREKLIITVSRFTVEKKLERIVDVASRLRDYTFVIIGTTYEHSDKVIETIRERMDVLNVDNVVIEVNMPREKLIEYFSRAKYYLHPEFAEHFGIAVVEAMAAGLIPIVYRDGGAWYDVVSRIHDMLGYKAIEEAAEIVRKIDRDRNLYEKLRRRSIEESKRYNYQSFKKKITEIVDYVARVKRIAGIGR